MRRLIVAAVSLGFLTGLQANPALAGDTRGGFVVACDYVRSLADDPIRFPNQPGASHLHDFFGNLSTNAASTRGSMLASNSSCKDWDDSAGYWSPTGYLNGVQITPLRQRVYYFGSPSGSVQTIPANLAYIGGNHNATSAAANPHVSWDCGGTGTPSSTHPYNCTPYQGINKLIDGVVGHVDFPQCWDQKTANIGSSTSSPINATSDMTYAAKGCPSGYVRIPQLQLRVHFGIWDPCAGATPCGPNDSDANVLAHFSLSPDPGSASPSPYYTLHADFWNTWKQGGLNAMVSTCLNTHQACGAATAFTPGSPALTATPGDTIVHLSWTPPSVNASGITGYAIYRGTSSQAESEITTVGNVSTWDDTSVTNATQYFYVLRAMNSYGEGNGSPEQDATPTTPT